MDKNHHFQEDIIIKVLLNEATSEEVSSLEAWLKEDSQNRERFQELQNTWNTLEVERSVSVEKIEQDWLSVANRIQTTEESPSHGKVRSLLSNLTKIAAVLAIGVVGYFLPTLFSDSVQQQSYNVISAPNGSKTEILLPDNSKVLLNAGSTLRYPERFSKNQREVYLEGEAFFEVKSDQQKKFIVKTSGVTIKVYGTSFNVKAHRGESTIETTLVKGKISIANNTDEGNDGEEILMEANQQAIWTSRSSLNSAPQQQIVIVKEIDTEIYTAWTEGILVIKGETLQNLAVKLERRYGVKITFRDEEVKAYRFTGTIKNETIEQVLTVIKLVSNIDYVIKENVVTIKKNK